MDRADKLAPIPLRCFCGNAVLRPRMDYEQDAREVVTSICPECECEMGDTEQTYYTDESGRLLTFVRWMEHKGLEL